MTTTAQLIHEAAMLVETSIDYDADTFAENLEEFLLRAESKIVALRCVHKAAESRAASLKAEAALYAAAAKTHAANADRVKDRAYMLMEAAELTGEVLTGARLQANGGSAPLVYAPGFVATDLPFDLQRVSVEPNADAIRAALAKGEAVPGVTVGERGRSLRWTEAK